MLAGSMSAWADTLLIRVLSGLGVLLLTAAQPKALTWHHGAPEQADPSPGNSSPGKSSPDNPSPGTPMDGGRDSQRGAGAPDAPGEKKHPRPLTLGATLPQTMSPRAPVGTLSEAERQAGNGRFPISLAGGADDGAIAAIVARLRFDLVARREPMASLDAGPRAGDPHRLLCVISPAGPPLT